MTIPNGFSGKVFAERLAGQPVRKDSDSPKYLNEHIDVAFSARRGIFSRSSDLKLR